MKNPLRHLLPALVLLFCPGALLAQGQSVAGVDVFVHCFLPLNSMLEKVTIQTVRDHGELVPVHLSADRTLLKFTPENNVDLEDLVTILQVRGVPVLGVEVMWTGNHLFRAAVPGMGGAWTLEAVTGPSEELRNAAKQAWVAANPGLYEEYNRTTP